MELYVPRLLPSMPSDLFFFIVTACCASLLIPCSVCLDAQYEYCQNAGSRCGNISIKYPFGVGNRGCGVPTNFQINCVQNENPAIEIGGRNYAILEIYYDSNNFLAIRNASCQFLDDPSNIGLGYADNVFGITSKANWTLNVFHCNRSVDDNLEGRIKKCNATVYYSIAFHTPPGCSMGKVSLPVARMNWVTNDTIRDANCISCQASGGICGYNVLASTAPAPFLCYCRDGPRTLTCPRHGRGNKSTSIIIGYSLGGIALTAIGVLFLTFYAKKRIKRTSHSSASKVEKFLREYAFEMPTRYSQSQLKKITNNFAERLGEGGFGVVYKGKFRNGTLVAVKVIDRQRHSEAQFMNEVATIGHVHHVNLVRLLGYCFEGLTNALVYEYMVNGSLDKFIFGRKEKGQMLSCSQLYSIALGAARGITYLHQDCEKRIIHFDIKPHNILLDADFTPKVSDFGLAKLCGKGADHVSMTGGRGTPGYVAPEVCNGDEGPVTDKSDVYSFGMVLLEIAGRRKNINWRVSRSSQFYFPEWAFKLLKNEELGMILRGAGGGVASEEEAENEEKVRRLIKIGLWCIQYKSTDRPCMSRIVQMLEGNGDDLTNPPWPFDISSAAPEIPLLLPRTEEFSLIEIT